MKKCKEEFYDVQQIIKLMSESERGILLHKSKQRYKSFTKMILISLSIALSNFYFGYNMVYLGTIPTATLKQIYSITLSDGTTEGILNGCIPFGAFIGALGSSILIAQFSRRRCILIVNTFAILLGILVYIPNFYLFLFVRISQGICVGCCSSFAPLINKEIIPNEISGTLGTFVPMGVTIGIFTGYTLKYILVTITGDSTGKNFWQYEFGFPLITLTLQTLIFLFVFPYQTPKYLLLKGKLEEARKLLAKIYKDEYVEEVLQEKKEDLASAAKERNLAQRDNLQTTLVPKESQKNNIPTIVALHLSFMQQFSGTNAVAVYLGQISGKVAPNLKDLMPPLIKLSQIIMILFLSYLLSKLGRKFLLQAGTFVVGISCLIIMVGFLIQNDNPKGSEVLVFIGVFIYVAIFGLSMGPIVWMYIPEIVEPKIVPFSTAANWIGAFIVIFLFPIIRQKLLNDNPAFLFLFFGVWCFGSFLLNTKFLIETKDKTQKQIRQEYKRLKLC